MAGKYLNACRRCRQTFGYIHVAYGPLFLTKCISYQSLIACLQRFIPQVLYTCNGRDWTSLNILLKWCLFPGGAWPPVQVFRGGYSLSAPPLPLLLVPTPVIHGCFMSALISFSAAIFYFYHVSHQFHLETNIKSLCYSWLYLKPKVNTCNTCKQQRS